MKIKQFYIQEWISFKTKYIKIFIFVSIFFVLVMVFSHFFLVSNPDRAEQSFTHLAKRFFEDGYLTGFVGCLKLFFHNSVRSLFIILFGLIPFLFLPLWGSIINGFYGGVVTSVSSLLGFSVISLLLCTMLPHGIFEIPALLYASCLGIYLCLNVSKRIFWQYRGNQMTLFEHQEQESEEPLTLILKRMFMTWIGIIIPLLLIAAFIETFITSLFVSFMKGIPK